MRATRSTVVTACSTAESALAILRSRKDEFDIVLSDVHMPDMDGFKLLEIIQFELSLPVLMMSANSDSSVVLRGIIHGAVDYLLKPVRIEELRNIWQHVVRRDYSAKNSGSDDVDASSPSKRLKTSVSNSKSDEVDRTANEAGSSKARKKPASKKGGAKSSTKEVDKGDMTDASKKPRVVWSAELHAQFVTAVNQLGIDKAVPKRILDLMGVQGLTRENVASHLQKYRLYLKRLQGNDMMRGTTNGTASSSGAHNRSKDAPMVNSGKNVNAFLEDNIFRGVDLALPGEFSDEGYDAAFDPSLLAPLDLDKVGKGDVLGTDSRDDMLNFFFQGE